MEVNLAMNLEDAKRYGLEGGFQHAGSSCGRHVEKLYVEGRLQGSLERAATALFDGTVKHALVVSGFYVLHDRLEGATGSCRPALRPAGALAVVRALCARGVQTSLYCDAHNGPVLKAGFDAMVDYYETTRPAVAARLRSHCRCVDVPDGVDHLEALKKAPWKRPGRQLARSTRSSPSSACPSPTATSEETTSRRTGARRRAVAPRRRVVLWRARGGKRVFGRTPSPSVLGMVATKSDWDGWPSSTPSLPYRPARTSARWA